MYLDYSKIAFDAFGRPEMPVLMLRTMGGDNIGTLSNVTNLKINIKYSEPSEISFEVPAYSDGIPTPYYDDIVGYKVLYTDCYGVYLILQPSSSGDGIREVKQVTAYSIEKELEFKRFFLEEGTFNFWNPVSTTDTVLSRILECAPGWTVGYVSPSLIGRYRTFDSYDDYLLSFIYNSAPDKFRCVFVFDPYKRTINAYDADEERPALPIFLDFDNLIKEIEVEELSDELVTAIRPYGADSLDIRAVNPIGTNWIYDISYFISNGDIPSDLASKWEIWQKTILSNQSYYKGLVALQSSATAQLLSEQSALVDLNGELEDLTNQQSVTIQALAMETTDTGKRTQQELLDEINRKIAAKKSEISQKKSAISDIQSQLDADNPNSYSAQIAAIVDRLAISKFFTEEEYRILSKYFIEQDITEDTFVATDIDSSVSGEAITIENGNISITGSKIEMIDLTGQYSKNMYVIAGGTFSVTGNGTVNGDIIRGTIELKSDGAFVLSIYTGNMSTAKASVQSGMITISGTAKNFSSDIHEVTKDGISVLEGTQIKFSMTGSTVYMTANVSEYQKYSVQMELYDYAVDVLNELSTPTYEFSVDAGNFLFSNEFDPFRNSLELGKGVYLRLSSGETITPIIIEFEIDFEDHSKFSIVFSNRFKRHDNVNTLKDMIESSYSSSRSFDASKYIYNQTAGQASQVSEFMNSSLNAAVNTIIGASNQSVIINGAGIHIGGESNYQIRIVDNMIAFTDDNWSTAKMALGMFSSPEVGTYFGVNAEVIGGKLFVGNNLVIENTNDDGVMQFKVDSTGAWLNNSTFVLQKDNGGKLIIDPTYGILAGKNNLFSTSGTTVYPSFIGSDGRITFDSDGMPLNTNFFLDIRDGSAYFRGKLMAQSGKIGGFNITDGYLYTGSGSNYVALNGSGSNSNAAYAIWAGGSSPSSAKFYVRKDGTLYARDGTFSGTLSAARVSGALTAAGSDSWIVGCGININNGVFMVDQAGNVTMNGNLTLRNGVISWSNLNPSVTGAITDAQNTAYNAYNAAMDASDDAYYAERLARRIADGEFSGGTFINRNEIYSPTIYADEFVVMPSTNQSGRWTGGYSMYGYFGPTLYKMLSISYADTGFSPEVEFWSPCGAYAYWGFDRTNFYGWCDFSGANVTGIEATFG